MRRREFIAGLGGAAAWPVVARAQQTALPVIGCLWVGAVRPNGATVTQFKRFLAEAGYVEGRNVAFEFRFTGSQYDRLPALAAELVDRRVAVIFTPFSTVATQAAKAATQTIPIVFITGDDPVDIGLVASLNRPGGNLTGFAMLAVEIARKRFEMLREMLPAAKLIAVLSNPTSPTTVAGTKEMQRATLILGVRLLVLNATTPSDIEAAFATLAQEGAEALVVLPDGFLSSNLNLIIALAARHAVPTIGGFAPFAAAGGLMAYHTRLEDAWRTAANYTARILKGEKPGDLPVQQSTRIELTINMKTAKALGLTIPETLLVTADEVIQ
jgi:putative ABC transport system substrate-binding protein